MTKKQFSWPVVWIAFVAVILMYGANVMAYGTGEKTEKIYKTDRTLVKEVLANQKTTHALLRDIKGQLQALK